MMSQSETLSPIYYTVSLLKMFRRNISLLLCSQEKTFSDLPMFCSSGSCQCLVQPEDVSSEENKEHDEKCS